jgi:hypothetical protein
MLAVGKLYFFPDPQASVPDELATPEVIQVN